MCRPVGWVDTADRSSEKSKTADSTHSLTVNANGYNWDSRNRMVADVISGDFGLPKSTMNDCRLLGVLYFDPDLHDDVLRVGRA